MNSQKKLQNILSFLPHFVQHLADSIKYLAQKLPRSALLEK